MAQGRQLGDVGQAGQVAGTYTLILTVTDGWGDAATTIRPVTVTAPAP